MDDATAATRPPEPGASRYQPLVVVLGAVAGGAILDRYSPLSMPGWLAVGCGSLAAWCVTWRLGAWRLASVPLLIGVAAIAAAWHHATWSLFERDHLLSGAGVEPAPVCVEAVALESPRWIPAPGATPLRAQAAVDRSQLTIAVERVRDGTDWRGTTGRVRLTLDGHLLGVQPGDRLRVVARLSRPSPPRNPGEFDFAGHDRAERHVVRLDADSPDCVTRLEASRSLWPHYWLSGLRSGGNRLLWSHVHHHRAGLAAAILLGTREQIDPERTESFLTSGTIHILSISGLHVGILAYAFWLITRSGWLARGNSLIMIAVLVCGYAVLVGAQPPVVRAAMLIVVVCLARWLGRASLGFNALAGAAVVVFALRPASLFHVGTQLSFLAVATLIGMSSWSRPTESRAAGSRSTISPDPLDRLIARSRPWLQRVALAVVAGTWRILVASTIIWLVAAPLVAYHFHLVSPVAILLNPLLAMPVAVALLAGFGVLTIGWLFPPAAWPLGALCDGSLRLTEWLIESTHGLPGGFFWVARPPAWWVISWYVALALCLALPRWRPPARWLAALAASWLAAGLFATHGVDLSAFRSGTASHATRELSCTFVSVGHGTCVVVELPDGRTMLYDGGSMGGPSVAARWASGVLWSRGITHLDAIVVSHADIDHYNAVPELLERFSVGVVYVTPRMFARESEALVELRGALERRRVPVRLAFADHRLDAGEVGIEVLHPLETGCPGSDNANSIVLAIEYQGRRVLLPGDLEGRGMAQLCDEMPRDFDVVMAPHHGSLTTDHERFAAWSTPEWVVVSGGFNGNREAIRDLYSMSGARLLHTAESGAVRVTIRDGQIHLRGWLDKPW